jgi:hypothetical protein
MSTTAVKVTVDSAQVRKVMASLPMKLNESVRKKSIRKVFQPAVKELRQLWKSASYRGKPLHRRAIASATKLLPPKRTAGPGSPIRIELGVQYGRKGGSRAKGRQRVWHLLENGFKHKGSGNFIAGSKRSITWASGRVQSLGEALQKEILKQAAIALGRQNVS